MITLALVLAVCTQNFALPADAAARAKECSSDPDQMCFTVLAETYANAKKYDIAEYFLCRAEHELAPVEYEGMQEHLRKMRSGEAEEPLDFCDHSTSGYGFTYCAHKRWDALMPRLNARLERFAEVREAANAFIEAETQRIGEQSRDGTGYIAITVHAELDAKERVVRQLETYSKKRAAGGEGDQELNAAYRKARGALEDEEMKTLLRDAQRAWIRYRDAFAAFYVVRWKGAAKPEVLRSEIVAQLSRDRAAELAN